MVAPSGFWDTGVAGEEEFSQDLMNACLAQIGSKVTIDTLTDRAGMFSFSSDDHRFWRSDGAAQINLGIIEFGVDAVKPAASAANNGRIFFATDTLTLYVVDSGTQYLVSDQNVVVDHVALADPHTQYQKESEKGASNGYAGLTAGSVVDESDIDSAIARVSALHNEDHQARHDRAGADEIDGDVLDIDYTPTHYVPDTAPAEVTDVNELSAHLKGIDTHIISTLPGAKGITEIINNTSVFQNDDDWAFTALANKIYLVIAHLHITASGGSAGFKGKFSLPAGAAVLGVIMGHNEENSGSGNVVTSIDDIISGEFQLPLAGGANNINHYIIHAIVTIVGTSGTIQFQWAQNSAQAFDLRLTTDSFMCILS